VVDDDLEKLKRELGQGSGTGAPALEEGSGAPAEQPQEGQR
jgi:hypothetical protein